MTKQEALQILKLLSALESCSLSDSAKTLPDYLYDAMNVAVEVLEREILK